MGIFSRFERKMEDSLESAADRISSTPISPVQISKQAEKAMRREKVIGAGKQHAPTLYTILVNAEDDRRLFGYYPTLAGETETYLAARAAEEGLQMDGQPLVRFIADEGLKHGKFDIIAELVSAPIIAQLREEEMERYGLAPRRQAMPNAGMRPNAAPIAAPAPIPAPAPAPVENIFAGLNVSTFEPYENNGFQPAQREANTIGFVDGDGRATPVPRTSAVRASLVFSATNRRVDLAVTRVILGRSSDSDVILDDINASRTHAELRLEAQGKWSISDLGSTNGTYVNGRPVATQLLSNGDRIVIGSTDLFFIEE